MLKYADELEEFSNYDFTDKVVANNEKTVRIGGSISELKMHFDRKNNQMAFFKLECLGGQVEILTFSDTFSKYRSLIANDAVVFVKGKPTDGSDFSDLKLIADEIIPLDKARDFYSKNVNIRLEPSKMSLDDVDSLYSMVKDHKGKCGLMIHISTNLKKDSRIFSHNIKVSSHASFLKKLRDNYGKENIWVSD